MLVNSRSNKVVNIASTKMMKRFFGTATFSLRIATGFPQSHGAGEPGGLAPRFCGRSLRYLMNFWNEIILPAKP
jgi:hypothetical protein